MLIPEKGRMRVGASRLELVAVELEDDPFSMPEELFTPEQNCHGAFSLFLNWWVISLFMPF